MKHIFAKFTSKCAETGNKIFRGEPMLYNYTTKKCYCIASKTYKAFEVKTTEEYEARSVSDYVNAQENAFVDNRYFSAQ